MDEFCCMAEVVLTYLRIPLSIIYKLAQLAQIFLGNPKHVVSGKKIGIINE